MITELHEPETWPTSAVHDDILLALRDVAARNGGAELVGDAFDLAEQRQAERHRRDLPVSEWDRPDPPMCRKVSAIAFVAAVLIFAAGIGTGVWIAS